MFILLRLLSLSPTGYTTEQIIQRTNITEPSLLLEDLIQNGYVRNIETDNGSICSGPRFKLTTKGLRKLKKLEQQVTRIPISRLIKTFQENQVGSSFENGFSLEA
jgi:hypothetical protein